MSEFKSLPVETLTDILIRLPVESLRHCMCVCKSWRSLIADSFFINKQLLINRQGCSTGIDNRRFLLKSRKLFGNKLCYSLHCCKTFTEQKQLKVPNVIEGWSYLIIASCNGLLCLLLGYSRALLLWNPSIKKFKILPKSRFQSCSSHELAHGFAFVPRANDYKVVRLIHDKVEGSPKVEIYTLSKNSWRTWIGDGVRCAMINRCRPAFVNGAVHWTGHKKCGNKTYSDLIIAFHMEDEVFREIPIPGHDLPLSNGNVSGFLSVVGEKLAYLVNRYMVIEGGVSWDLWVLEDYGVAEFWTKLQTMRSHTIESFLHPMHSLKKGEILFGGLKDKELYSFDLERQEFKEIGVDGMQFEFEVFNYTESLVLLNEGIPDSSSEAMIDLEEKEKEEAKDRQAEGKDKKEKEWERSWPVTDSEFVLNRSPNHMNCYINNNNEGDLFSVDLAVCGVVAVACRDLSRGIEAAVCGVVVVACRDLSRGIEAEANV
ncbi:hypothetical protein RHGRI_025491 [Rhododendron griersonianum]|uniref:F-box domain-containing protein n=1 Tax=Rhododendron griersonianum TaxID=479676 RepID=A0AAV6ITS4_9ERIC|nr:hypothetical protein RHGRI_025491 [Rhododendron griersonianum]